MTYNYASFFIPKIRKRGNQTMSKFFMYGIDLHELEQLMMLVPNFMPRRSGVTVVKKVENKKEPVGCQACDYPISDCCNDTLCIYLAERLAAGLLDYAAIVENHFKDNSTFQLNRRLDYMVRNIDGDFFFKYGSLILLS
jgi:hypothetical protein